MFILFDLYFSCLNSFLVYIFSQIFSICYCIKSQNQCWGTGPFSVPCSGSCFWCKSVIFCSYLHVIKAGNFVQVIQDSFNNAKKVFFLSSLLGIKYFSLFTKLFEWSRSRRHMSARAPARLKKKTGSGTTLKRPARTPL